MQTNFALVDCNNFFCSCERVFDPSLTEVPVVVLSNNDGCIISRSEEAKALQIPMGAPLHEQAQRIKENGVRVFSSNYTLYGDMSARVMTILRDVAPSVEVYSIDEAFLELPDGFGEEEAKALRQRLLQWTGIPVCIGIGPTKVLAKLANRHAKKNKDQTGGVFDIGRCPFADLLMGNTPCDALWGVGKSLASRLRGMRINSVLDFKSADASAIRRRLGVVGERMLRELNGISCMELEETPPQRKGIVASRSFGTAIETLDELREALANHVARASAKLRKFDLLATHVQVFLCTNRFRPEEKQYHPASGVSLATPTASTSELMAVADRLLERIYRSGYRYKKTGVMLAPLVSAKEFQPSLFEPNPGQSSAIDKIVDDINRRMGSPGTPVIKRASQGTICGTKSWQMRREKCSPSYTTNWHQLPVARI
jgi:DNA polymerase V